MGTTFVEYLNEKDIYDLMDISDKIYESRLLLNRGHSVYVAFDNKNRIVAVGDGIGERETELKAIARGSHTPFLIQGNQVGKDVIDNHNLLLDKSLEKRAKEDLERKTRESA